MDPATVESLKEALTPLAEKFGESGAAAWEIAVRQQYVEAIRALVWPVLLVAAVVLSWRCFRWWQAHEDREANVSSRSGYESLYTQWRRDDRRTLAWTAAMVLGAAILILTIGTAVEGTAAIGRLINPEWYALRSLLDLVTS